MNGRFEGGSVLGQIKYAYLLFSFYKRTELSTSFQ